MRLTHTSGDPATLALADAVRIDVASVNAAIGEANDSVTKNQLADAALASIHEKLESMREMVEDAALVDHSAEELTALDAQYQALASDVVALMADTQFAAASVLSGSGAVVSLDLSAATSLSLTDLPDNALDTMTAAAADVGAARGELRAQAAALGPSLEDLVDRLADLTALERRITAASEALVVVRSVGEEIVTDMATSLAAQVNSSSAAAAAALLSDSA